MDEGADACGRMNSIEVIRDGPHIKVTDGLWMGLDGWIDG